MKDNYQNLFQDYTFKSGVHVKNRLMMAPMTTFSADEKIMFHKKNLIIIKNVQMELVQLLRHVHMFRKMEKALMVKWALTMMVQLKAI